MNQEQIAALMRGVSVVLQEHVDKLERRLDELEKRPEPEAVQAKFAKALTDRFLAEMACG